MTFAQTCLLYSYARGEFPRSYVPTVRLEGLRVRASAHWSCA